MESSCVIEYSCGRACDWFARDNLQKFGNFNGFFVISIGMKPYEACIEQLSQYVSFQKYVPPRILGTREQLRVGYV